MSDIKPWKDGKWRCPYNCHDSRFPAPKWKTEKGFLKHLAKCPETPNSTGNWQPPPAEEPTIYGSCADCGEPILKGTSIWSMAEREVCFECREEYEARGIGFHDCAGLVLPGVTLEG